MEEHGHVAGNSTQPAAPRVGTLHAIPPTMVRLLDLQNSITVQLNLSKTAPLGTEESRYCREVAIMGR